MMKQIAVLLIAVGCVAGSWSLPQRPPRATQDDPYQVMVELFDVNQVCETGRRLEKGQVNQARFHANLERILAELEADEINLAQAVDRCIEEAYEWHPDFLHFLRLVEPSGSVRERVARNLIRHFRLKAQEEAAESHLAGAVTQRLERELRELFPSSDARGAYLPDQAVAKALLY